MGAGDLSAALWQERRQLELLIFRLETQRLHVLAGNLQWLSFTAAEVEGVLERLRFEALARSVESAAVAAEWGLPAQATLAELVAGAPAGAWPEMLQNHLDGLRALLAQLSDAARDNEDILRHLDFPVPSGASTALGSDANGTVSVPADTQQVLDQLTTAGNIEHALAVTRRAPQPLLTRYLDGNRD
ncbi:flagellar protein FlgN [Micrococcaceae bacterium Sec7.4]